MFLGIRKFSSNFDNILHANSLRRKVSDFALSFRKKLLADVFECRNADLAIKGNFGYIFPHSKPLATFSDGLPKLNGQSTPPNGSGGWWLKGGLNTPLSTSGVANCAVCVLVNSKTNEHFLYHVLVYSQAKNIGRVIEKVMGKDFDKAFIIPGGFAGTEITSHSILKALNKINPKTSVEYRHVSKSRAPEIVAWGSEVYEVPLAPNRFHQASFGVVENSDDCFL